MIGNRAVLVAGGAGFLGSAIAEAFLSKGDRVTVVDGLFPRTGGRVENLAGFIHQIEFLKMGLEAVPDLPTLLAAQDVIVDAMAWTSHHGAMENPEYDLELNVRSHLKLLGAMGRRPRAKIILLGSRGQFGRSSLAKIGEEASQEPVDVQGIHKVAAESYFRVYALTRSLNVCALRLPNCFGPRQPISGTDIGLIGGFIRDLIAGKPIEIFGGDRRRSFAYCEDVASAVVGLADRSFEGFNRLNMAGDDISIGELVGKLRAMVGGGHVNHAAEAPAAVKAMEVGSAAMAETRLREWLPGWQKTELDEALNQTILYFRGVFA